MIAAQGTRVPKRHDGGDAAAYLPLVHALARRLGRRLPPYIEHDDLVGAGVVGLMEALQRFDPGRQTAFVSYAEFRIRGAMLDELRRRDLMARDARTESKRFERAVEALAHMLGRPPQEDELARHVGLSVCALREKLGRLTPVRVLSLDTVEGAEHAWGAVAVEVHEATPSPSPFEALHRRQRLHHLTAAIGRLPERQQQILQLYYREELTLSEIGRVLEVTESRVSQLMTAITTQLRAFLRGKDTTR